MYTVVVFQSLSQVWLFATTWTAERQGSLSFTIFRGLLKLMSIESVMLSHHLILCHHRLLLSSTFSSIRVFSNESALCIRWTKYWGFSFSISPSNNIHCMCICVLVTRLCPTLCNPMDYSLPGSPVHGISQARILEWGAIPFPRESF